jgi:hypothetical protein
MIFRGRWELVRPADAEKWFGITPEAVEEVRKLRAEVAGRRATRVVALPKARA